MNAKNILWIGYNLEEKDFYEPYVKELELQGISVVKVRTAKLGLEKIQEIKPKLILLQDRLYNGDYENDAPELTNKKHIGVAYMLLRELPDEKFYITCKKTDYYVKLKFKELGATIIDMEDIEPKGLIEKLKS